MKRILNLNNFGSFKSFAAKEDLLPFTKYNLFFAYNGSGKTTFSRFLKFLSKGGGISSEFSADGYEEDFKIELDDDSIVSSFAEYPNQIKVFNSDFISTELKFEENEISPISVDFGKGRRELRKKIARLNEHLDKLYEKNTQGELTDKYIYSSKLSEATTKFENIFKDNASEIREELSLDSNRYKNVQFRNAVKAYNKSTKLVSDEDVEIAKKTYKQKVMEPIKYRNQTDIILTEEELTKVNDILRASVSRKGSTLKQEIIDWIDVGKNFDIKDNDNRCFFCNSPIPNWDEKLKELNEIIAKDDEFEKFDNQFKEMKKIIENKLEQSKQTNFLKSITGDISELEFLDIYKSQAKKLKDEGIVLYKELYESNLSSILHDLKQKELDYSYTNFQEYEYEPIKNLNNEIINFSNLIDKNNADISSLENKKNSAFIEVENYHIQKEEENINKLSAQIEEYGEKVSKAEDLSNKIKDKLKILNNQLENQEEAIEEIENYIETIFSYKKFKFNFVETEKNYKIIREDGKEARHLSEGEKTVIAFSYFLATLKDKDFDIKHSIIVIDDPVSSLDQNYLYNLLILLYKRFKKPTGFNQLFVLTHNFYFFKKLRDILKHKNKDTKDSFHIYQIKKDENTSYIINATTHFINFQSEYLAKIEELKKAYEDETATNNIEIGVAIRKIFEIFLSYQAPYEDTLFAKFEKVFKDSSTNKYRYLENIANASCHTDEIDDLDTLEPFKLCVGRAEIQQLFAFIREIDKVHADALELPIFDESDKQ